MRKALRWLRRIVLSVLALALIAVTIVVIALHTNWGREKVRAKLEAVLQGQFPGGAHVGKLEGSVFGELVVHDFELDDELGHPAVTVGTLRVEIALLPLLRKTARVDRLIVEDVAVLGIPALAASPPPPTTPSAPNKWSIDLPDVRVLRGMVRYATPKGPVELDALDLTASAALPAGAPITAKLAVTGTWQQRNAPFAVTGTVLVDNQHVEVPEISATLGGVSVTGSNLLLAALSGHLAITAPAAAVTALVPELVLPGDVRAEVDAKPAGNATRLVIDGTVGAAELHGSVLGDVEERHAIGFISARAPELRELTRGQLIGSGGVIAALDGAFDAIHGVIFADGQPALGPRGSTAILVSGMGDTGHALVLTTAEGGATSAVIADLTRKGDAITIARGRLFARAPDLAAATAWSPALAGALRGYLRADATVSGTITPVLALDVSGSATGLSTGYAAMGAQTISARFDARVKGTLPIGHAHVELAGVANGAARYGRVTIDAANHADGTINAVIHAEPRDQVAVDLDARVTLGPTITVDLGGHKVSAPGNQHWAGTGGRVAITPTQITIKGFRTASATGSASVDAEVGRASGDLAARVVLAHLDVGGFDPRYAGIVDGTLSVERKRGRWGGSGQFDAVGMTVDGRPPMTGELHLDLAGRRATVTGHMGNPDVGSVELTLDVDGPRELIDVEGWRRVDRRDVRLASIVLHTIALARLDPKGTGVVDGTLVMTGQETHGLLNVKGVQTPAGEVSADITLAPAGNGQIAAVAEATLIGVGTADLGGLLVVPDQLFDPVAWRLLGRNAIRAASAQLDDLAFDPTVLAKLKVIAPYRGTVGASIAIGPGATSSQITIDVHDLQGGALLKPIDLHAETKLDEHGTIADAAVRSAKTLLVQLHGEAPLTFERVRSVGGSFAALRDVPITGTFTLPSAELKDVLAMFGRTDLSSGTADGTVTVGGTLGTPTGKALIAAHGVSVTSRTSNRPTPKLDELTLVGTWGGAAGSVELTGKESNGGTLHAIATGGTELAGMAATLDIAKFELAPLAAFLPGAAGAAAGTLDASLTVRGFDPPTSHIRGRAHIVDGRMPLSPTIGTLRRATIDFSIDDHAVTAKLDGKLGSGTVHVEGGGDLAKLDITARLVNISIINALQPTLTADLTAHLRHDATWTGSVAVRNAIITVPEQAGNALLATSAPSDLIFVDGSNLIVPPPVFGSEPAWLVLDFDIGSTKLDLNLLGGDLVVQGSVISPHLVVSVGGGAVGLSGVINSESALVDLFGHRYQVDPARLTFVDSTDAELQITMVHEFADVALIVTVTGTASDPKIDFTSEPGTYAQSQLLGFFLGGEPGGDPNNATREAAAGAGAALASSRLSRAFNKLVPIKVVLKCEAATTATSNSCAIGKWFSEKLYGVINYHQGALITENASEFEIQYYMLKSLLLDGIVGDRQFHSLDLLWRHRW